ncbi:DNA-directed RNA polymerase III subunit RPC8-like [Hibiscus syriacus]|uniref:DNA-directed RNA polymerase III subunit RPC8-like n=1 Tax=Hibiscus syriacus TaxID=106335 RepID=A0A6A2X7L9_HIBSY|nr:uncharacterized protein LOC120173614 [Hibiscus syriacus]KAE8671333.1 DNA-directed RNA polymerase III subunit RPC8-like [Hibiscus syriacus]
MMKICLMASHGYPQRQGLVLHQEQGVRIKECGSLIPSQITKQDMVRIGSFDLRTNRFEELPKPVTALPEPKLIIDVDLMLQKPVIINKSDAYLDTELLGFGIAEKCTRHEKILKFLMSGSNELEKGELDLSLLSELIGLQPVMFGMHQQPYDSYLIYPSRKIDSQMPLPDFFGEMVHNSKVAVSPDGQVILTACGTEMKDILSIVAEFYLSSNSTKWRKQSSLVPYFDRKQIMKARTDTNLTSPKFEVASIAPLESPDKIKLKPYPKKGSKKLGRERDLYRKNYFHACECLLSLMVDKRRLGRTAVLSLKKSGPELPQLLTQFSASIAGAGLAVLFSVIFKVACGRVPFDTSKLFSTGLAFGLVWLSQSVNRLRDTVIHISKNTSKSDMQKEEIIKRVERSVNQIYFRAATLMAVAVLKFV